MGWAPAGLRPLEGPMVLQMLGHVHTCNVTVTEALSNVETRRFSKAAVVNMSSCVLPLE